MFFAPRKKVVIKQHVIILTSSNFLHDRCLMLERLSEFEFKNSLINNRSTPIHHSEGKPSMAKVRNDMKPVNMWVLSIKKRVAVEDRK
jgi:hypothetical protein